jgi:antitoxin ParD1/3/4
MTRQSVSFTAPNNEWLEAQIQNKEYKNKSELINDLVRKERAKQQKTDFIRAKLIAAEQKGFTSNNQQEILAAIKKDLSLGKNP